MIDSPLYSESEMEVIDVFLRDCVDRAAAEKSFALPINPEEQAKPELERLQKKRKANRNEIVLEDVRELEDAVKSPFAPTFHVDRDETLQQLRHYVAGSNQNDSIGMLFLKHFAERLCATASKPVKPSAVLISAGGLAWLLGLLNIPPASAPVVVWLATKLRDIGVPAFCDTLQDFLKKRGVSP